MRQISIVWIFGPLMCPNFMIAKKDVSPNNLVCYHLCLTLKNARAQATQAWGPLYWSQSLSEMWYLAMEDFYKKKMLRLTTFMAVGSSL